MSREDLTIGIDIGTTGVKAVAADENGDVRARVRIPHRLRVPAPDRLEHDADEAWRRGPLAALDQLTGIGAKAVAVAAMVPSMTAVDSDGTPVSPGLLYGDARGQVAGTAEQRALPLPAVGEAAEFLRWTAAQAPRAAGYWPAAAVANYALSGEAVIDSATAITSLPLFDGTGWNAAACSDCGATVDHMPRVESFGVAAGRVHGTDSVLATGAVDALCEQFVAGADREGEVLVLCGTTLIVWTTTSGTRRVPGLWTIPHTVAGLSKIGGASNAGGLFLEWVNRLVAPGDPVADLQNADPRRVPVWSPYIRGERTPFHDPHRRAVLDGLDLTHDAASVRRAAYEASGFVVRHLIELSGAPVARIVAAGGGSRVLPWMQAIADATGRPVEVSAVAEGGALGAAFLARMAVGLETTITDAARWARVEHVVDPQPTWVTAVEDRYRRFLELSDQASAEV
ncbi:xylulose kinase [Mycobacterium sp. 1164966.3]|uniref:xylulokinase n=1 Tax=Mycobacterium sp. 1164966.3 TaxID=1856861 RepID=UPI0007FDDE09|nr:FGGY-family carbohydrate kinase [Mycobacterium sp. 1164966.3]OBA80999.1 xylulose kinase [Mycobacterium sp. 1164966.3]